MGNSKSTGNIKKRQPRRKRMSLYLINDNENSRVLRKALTTSIKWKTRSDVDQEIEFYVEQLVLQQ